MDWGWKLLDFGALWRKRAPLGRGVSSRSTTPLLSSPYTGGNGGFKTRRKHLSWSVHLVAIPLDLVMRLMFFAKVDEGMHPYVQIFIFFLQFFQKQSRTMFIKLQNHFKIDSFHSTHSQN